MNRGITITALALSVVVTFPLAAQSLALDPLTVVREASRNELNANASDNSHWRYRDNERDLRIISFVVETPSGAIKQPIAKDGHPLSPSERASAQAGVQQFVNDPAAQHKQQRDAASDDKKADEFLNMLPVAFNWSISTVSPDAITLDFVPKPDFRPPSMEARVLGAMSGQIVVDKAQRRIRSIRGTLMQDVTFGWGVLGRLQKGGTFDVERRQVAPGLWEITATSVHISGHALFFKTIGENQDEVKTDFVEVPNSTTLEQAANMLQNLVEKESSPPANSARASR